MKMLRTHQSNLTSVETFDGGQSLGTRIETIQDIHNIYIYYCIHKYSIHFIELVVVLNDFSYEEWDMLVNHRGFLSPDRHSTCLLHFSGEGRPPERCLTQVNSWILWKESLDGKTVAMGYPSSDSSI